MSLRARLTSVFAAAALLLCGAASAQTLTSLTVSPTTITLGSNAVGTVTLSANAPSGGTLVTLSSTLTSAATVPANVTVPSGSKVATFTVTAVSVATNQAPTIKATLGTTTQQVPITVVPLFASFALNQGSALGGTTNPTGTVTLNGPAPTGGTTVTLGSSATAKATVPASITVPAGSSLATFSVTTLASAGSSTITAVSGGVTKTAALTVTTSPVPLSVAFAQASIKGGLTTTGTVTLNGPASGTGAVVTLTSGTTTIATVPANVTVPAGATSATFTATGVASASGSSTITAALNGTNATASLAVTPAPALLSVTFPVASIKASAFVTGTVSLNAPATANTTVTLAASPAGIVTIPANVVVSSGSAIATFTATAAASPAGTSVTITATYSSVNKTAVLGVTTAPALMSVTMSPATVLGGGARMATVALNANATSATTVTLYTSNGTVATVPATVTIASGTSSSTFSVTSIPVGAPTDVVVAAVSGGVTRSGTLTVTPALPATVTLNPTSVASGGTSQGTVTLSGPAPTGGTIVSLGSSNTAVATVPATVTVNSGNTSASFAVTALTVASSTAVTISATKAGISASSTLTVTPPAAALSSVSVSPTSVAGGTSSAGTVTLTSAAGTGGVTVALSSGSGSVTVPASVLVNAGTTSVGFTANTTPVPSSTPAGITASYSGVNKTATLTVNPPTLSSLALSPTAVTAPNASTGTVTLSSAAPANGLAVSLSSANTSIATVPASVTVAAGATTATFPATSLAVTSQKQVVLTATLAGTNKTATLTVNPCVTPIAPAPGSFPANDEVWLDDRPVLGTDQLFVWDAAQKASGTESHTDPAAAGVHEHHVDSMNPSFYVGPSETLFTYVLIDPCNPPREIMISWAENGSWEHRAYWGADLIPYGTAGTVSRVNMGPLPAAGQWVRLQVPTSAVGVQNGKVDGLDFTLYDGHAWFDRSGVARCTPPVAPVPTNFAAGDVVWMDDAVPPGDSQFFTWDPTQHAHGTASHTDGVGAGIHEHFVDVMNAPLYVGPQDTLVTYVLLDPCYPPSEVLLQWQTAIDGSWEHRAFWGADLIDWGAPGTSARVSMGALPATGQWARLEVPAAAVGLSDTLIFGLRFTTYDGRVWYDYSARKLDPGTPTLASFTVSPNPVIGGSQAQGTITLTAAATAGLPALNVTSTDLTVVNVPMYVSVPAGSTSTTFPLEATVVSTPVNETVTVTLDGVTNRAATVSVIPIPPVVTSLVLSPTNLVGGNSAQGTVTLQLPAAAPGVSVALSSSDPSATVPASVTVTTGNTTATFAATTSTVTSVKTATLTASVPGSSATASLVVTPPSLGTLALSPASVTGGVPSGATLTLGSAAPAGGLVVTLASSDPAATVPASVSIAAGGTTASFTVTTSPVANAVPVTISASSGGSAAAAILAVAPPGVASVTFSPSTAAPGGSATGTVTLSGNAPAAGLSVALASGDAAVAVPATVSVAGGSASGTFTASVSSSSPDKTVGVTASYAGSRASGNIIVRACVTPVAAAPTDFKANDVVWVDDALPGGNPQGFVWDTTQKASGTQSHTDVPVDGEHQHLVDSMPAFWVGPNDKLVTYVLLDPCNLPQEFALSWLGNGDWEHRAYWGADLLAFTTRVPMGALPAAGQWTRLEIPAATLGLGDSIVQGLAFTEYSGRVWFDRSGKVRDASTPALASVSFSPASVVGGNGTTGTVTLTAPATANLPEIPLTSSDPHVSVPASITVPAGATSQTFFATTTQVSTPVSSTVTATLDGTTASGTLQVQPITVSSVSATPGSVTGGLNAQGSVTISSPVNAGIVVTLSSSNPAAASVPASITLYGTVTGTFAITTARVSAPTNVTITASIGSSSQSVTISVTPLLNNLLVPARLVGGQTVNGTITLASVAPAGGYPVALTSSAPAVAAVPATATVPAGANITTFPITVAAVTSDTPVSFTATADSVTKTANSVATPFGLASLSFTNTPPLLAGQTTAVVTLLLNGQAPAGGISVALTASYGSGVPSSVTIAAGGTGTSISFVTPWRGIDYTLTLTAAYGATTKTASIAVQHATVPFSVSASSAPRGGSVWGYYTPPSYILPSCNTISISGADPTIMPPQPNLLGDVFVNQSGLYECRVLIVVPANAASGTTTLTSDFNGAQSSVPFTVLPSNLTGFGLRPGAVPAGTATTARLTLDTPAPLGGAVVTLSSSDPVAAPVPASATVPEGTSSVTFPVTPQQVTTGGPVTILATYRGALLTAKLKGLSSSAATLTGKVFDAAVYFVDKPLAEATASIAGDPDNTTWTDASGAFTLYAEPGSTAVTASLANYADQTTAATNLIANQTASLGGLRLLRLLGVGTSGGGGYVRTPAGQPIPGATVQVVGFQGSVTTDANGMFGFQFAKPDSESTRGYFRVTGSAPGYLLRSDTVHQGTIWGQPPPPLVMDAVPRPYLVSLSIPALVHSADWYNVSFTSSAAGPPAGDMLEFESGCTSNFNSSTCYWHSSVQLNPGDPAAAYILAQAPGINSNNPVPIEFLVGTYYGGVEKKAWSTVIPTGWTAVSAIWINGDILHGETPVTSGTTFGAVLYLNQAAPAGGAVISLSADDPSVVLPATVTVPEGGTSIAFSGSSLPLVTTTDVVIAASYNQVTTRKVLTLLNAVPRVSTVSATPSTLASGAVATGTVTLNLPAPAGGASVALTSSDPSATAPATVTVAAGATSATFPVTTTLVATTKTATLTASFGGASATATLTVNPPPPPTISGVAPGRVMAGDTTPVVYGTNFLQGTTVSLKGPVYATDFTTILCNLGAGQCASRSVAASASTDGTQLAFAVPADAASGLYLISAVDPVNLASTGTIWILVDDPVKTYSAITTPEGHHNAQPLVSGQGVVGTFLDHNDPTNNTNDYNFYYFVGTAGSHVRIRIERVDTSIPWENPASIDPQVEVFAPDGFVYQNLAAFDDVPSVDLNATIADAVLPLTGMYIVSAETTRGAGQYRLSYTLLSSTPASPDQRAIAIGQNGLTLPVGTTLHPTARMLDPRGYPISNASVGFGINPAPGDTGSAMFTNGSHTYTDVNGNASVDAKLLGAGKVRFGPAFDDQTLALGVAMPVSGSPAALALHRPVPRFQPVAFRSMGGMLPGAHGALLLGEAPLKRLQTSSLPVRRSGFERPGTRTPMGSPASAGGSPTPSLTPASAAPRSPVPLAPVPLVITSCSAQLTLFNEAGVNAPTVNAPFTVTLTDLTPSTGQSAPNGVVGADGIKGHRIEKKIRLKIDVKDSTGVAPTYPVLVSLAVGGPRPGKLILDPDGAKVECTTASFLWHERDNQGNIVALNEEFEYTLGTFSNYVGAIPNPYLPGQVKPVWGTGEILSLAISTADTNGLITPFEADYNVHPEPGKPHHFGSWDNSGNPDTDTFLYWNAYFSHPDGVKANGQPLEKVIATYANAYALCDQYDNVEFGYADTSATQTLPNLTTEFLSQYLTGDFFQAYRLRSTWTDDPQWPVGQTTSTLSVNFTDQEWGSGTVSKTITYDFHGGQTHAVIRHLTYEAVKPDQTPGVTDGPFPISVSPAATGDGLPKTTAGDGHRLALLLVKGTKTSGLLAQPEPFRDGHVVWKKVANGTGYIWQQDRVLSGQDPQLEYQEEVEFKMTLIDGSGAPVTNGEFRVNRCPRYDHESPNNPDNPRPCTVAAVDSAGGTIASVKINPSSADDVGKAAYIGLEVTKAPVEPGTYFVMIEALNGAQYWLANTSDFVLRRDPAEEYKGAFAVCNVQGAELLDQNFQRLDPSDPAILVDHPVSLYLTYAAPGAVAPSLPASISVTKLDESGGSPASLTLSRLGTSAKYFGRFVLSPPQTPSTRRALADPPNLSVSYSRGKVIAAVENGPTVKHPLRNFTISILSVGFSGDHKLTRWTDGTAIDPEDHDPLWTAPPAHNETYGAAYTSRTKPTAFVKLKITPPIPYGDRYEGTVYAHEDMRPGNSTRRAQANVTIVNDIVDIRDLTFEGDWDFRNTISSHVFKWEVTYDSGMDACIDAGESGMHKLYWLVREPIVPPFRDFSGSEYYPVYAEVVEQALDPRMESPDLPPASNLPLRLERLVYTHGFFEPDIALGKGHPFTVWDGSSRAYRRGFSSDGNAYLLAGMLRSVGIDAEEAFIWGGTPSGAYRYSFKRADLEIPMLMSFQAEMALSDKAPPDPHYDTHCVVQVGGRIYDPSYGLPVGSEDYSGLAFFKETYDWLLHTLDEDKDRNAIRRQIGTTPPMPLEALDDAGKVILCPHN